MNMYFQSCISVELLHVHACMLLLVHLLVSLGPRHFEAKIQSGCIILHKS